VKEREDRSPPRGSSPPLLEVRDLSVVARQHRGETLSIVERVSFDVRGGEVIALIGESGSGKTTISLACMGYVRPGCEITGGSVRLGDRRILDLSPRERREVLPGPVDEILHHRVVDRAAAERSRREVIDERPYVREVLLHATPAAT